ncbi:hypothetical protein BQ8794_20040 [Mesorhizobium prunaredense]|uniref:Uncharacterized protein n=1 Tax=Mesorhizobium prunaredense TaxID=1631249 RepID=A0A1R3V4Y5_9HYPH|nr:hypothetical protein BQ8794_20040 [Mesorhizobium prunaredense]
MPNELAGGKHVPSLPAKIAVANQLLSRVKSLGTSHASCVKKRAWADMQSLVRASVHQTSKAQGRASIMRRHA